MIIATVIVVRVINRALATYFKFTSEKLKVDETTYTVIRRWAVDFGISYDSDIDLARSIILDEIKPEEKKRDKGI